MRRRLYSILLSATALAVAAVAACLVHTRPAFESNFGSLRLAESAMILDRSTGEPYSGRLVARDDERGGCTETRRSGPTLLRGSSVPRWRSCWATCRSWPRRPCPPRRSRELSFEAGVRSGPQRRFFADGSLAEEIHYADGKPDGDATAYYADGTRRRHETWKAGERVGVSEAWYPDGTLQRREAFDGSSPRLQQWYSNGALAMEADGDELRELPPDGLVVEYYDTGQVRSKRHYEHGVEHDNGAKWAIAEYRNGKPIGEHRRWFPDGRLGYVKHHQNGRPHGPYKRWWADGTLRLDATYVQGKLHGEFRNWLEDGSVYELARYEAGKKVATTLESSAGT